MTKYWLGLVACMAALPVEAQTGIALAGAEGGSDAGYAYLGTMLPLPGSALGKGWVQRYWLDYNTYRYETNPAQDVDAKVAGFEAALGWHDSSEKGRWGAYLGGRYGNTRLRPDDPANDDRGDAFNVTVQLEGEAALARTWRVNGIVNHLAGESDFWSRVRLQTVLGNQLLVGPELVAQGDPRYRLYKLGAFIGGIKLGPEAALAVKAGASKQDSDSAGAFAGVEWYMPY